MKILFPPDSPLSSVLPATIIVNGSPAYLDNGIRAFLRPSEAEKIQEEGAVR